MTSYVQHCAGSWKVVGQYTSANTDSSELGLWEGRMAWLCGPP